MNDFFPLQTFGLWSVKTNFPTQIFCGYLDHYEAFNAILKKIVYRDCDKMCQEICKILTSEPIMLIMTRPNNRNIPSGLLQILVFFCFFFYLFSVIIFKIFQIWSWILHPPLAFNLPFLLQLFQHIFWNNPTVHQLLGKFIVSKLWTDIQKHVHCVSVNAKINLHTLRVNYF